jgi:hypothetical protein
MSGVSLCETYHFNQLLVWSYWSCKAVAYHLKETKPQFKWTGRSWTGYQSSKPRSPGTPIVVRLVLGPRVALQFGLDTQICFQAIKKCNCSVCACILRGQELQFQHSAHVNQCRQIYRSLGDRRQESQIWAIRPLCQELKSLSLQELSYAVSAFSFTQLSSIRADH